LAKQITISNHGKLGFHIRTLHGLVERDPVLERYRLTDRGQLAAELLWDVRFIIARGGRDLSREPTRYVQRLKLRDHAILFYDTEGVKRKITFPFFEAGLPKGEAVVYLVSEKKLDSENREIQGYGISTAHLRNEAFTLMSADEWYLKKRKAQAKTIIANWFALLKKKQCARATNPRT